MFFFVSKLHVCFLPVGEGTFADLSLASDDDSDMVGLGVREAAIPGDVIRVAPADAQNESRHDEDFSEGEIVG